jgi:ATP-binding protein involved in chromosome partitioning
MPSKEEVMKALEQVQDPELHRNIVDLGMVRDLKLTGSKVSFTLALTVVGCPMRNQMAQNAEKVLKGLPGIKQVEVTFGSMTEEERRKLTSGGQNQMPKLAAFNRVGQMIAVMSGKGGVGKSSVTALLAIALRRKGFSVGILDADITGPSIPRLFGLKHGDIRGSEMGMLPAITKSGIRAISINLFVEEEDQPVILRGPVISGTINQFWNEVIWGKLDYLLIDMPPGTSDAALTVIRSLPINGVVLVTTPQQLAGMVVRKGVNMLKQLEVPIWGVVENMSYFPCPDTGTRHEIFGPGHSDEIAQLAGSSVWTKLPIDPRLTALADAGQIEQIELAEMDEMMKNIPAPAFKPVVAPAFASLPVLPGNE